MPRSSKQTSRLSALLLGMLSCVLIGNTTGVAFAADKIDMSAPMGIANEQDLERWMTYYYLHPQPDLLVPALMLADQKGLLQGDAQAPFTAFISQVMAQNPTRIPGWFQQLQVLKDKSKPAILTALWWSNTKEGKEQLAAVIKSLPEKAQADLQSQCAGNATPIEKMDITSPAVLDELWGAFCATGDEKYVNRLMSTLPWVDADKDYNKLMIGGAARWSLTSNAQQHPKVMKLVLKTRETQPALRKVLDQVVSGTKKTAAAPAKTADAK